MWGLNPIEALLIQKSKQYYVPSNHRMERIAETPGTVPLTQALPSECEGCFVFLSWGCCLSLPLSSMWVYFPFCFCCLGRCSNGIPRAALGSPGFLFGIQKQKIFQSWNLIMQSTLYLGQIFMRLNIKRYPCTFLPMAKEKYILNNLICNPWY